MRAKFHGFTFHIQSKKSRRVIKSIAYGAAILSIISGIWVSHTIAQKHMKHLSVQASQALYASQSPNVIQSNHSQSLLSYLLYLFTDINFNDPSSLLGQIPAMGISQNQLVASNAS